MFSRQRGGGIEIFRTVVGNITNVAGAQIVVGGRSSAVFHDVVTNNGQFFVMPGSDVLMLENLSFTPWHTLPAHEPVGAVNRLRLTVYEALSRHRHRRNGVVSAEPVDLTVTPPLAIPNA